MTQMMIANPTAYEAALLGMLDEVASDETARRDAFAIFAETGLPHRRMEAWKWTDLRGALKPVDYPPVSLERPTLFRDQGVFTITLDEDGAHWGDGVPAGVTLRMTDEVADILPLLNDHPMARLTQSLAGETLIIAIADGAEIAAPIQLFRANGGPLAFRRVLVSLGTAAVATIIDTIEADDQPGLDNLLVEARVASGARLNRICLGRGSATGVDTATWGVELAAEAHFHQSGLLFGAKRSRFETRAVFTGPQAEASLFTASLIDGERHGDLTTHIAHGAEACFTEQVHKSVVAGRGQSVFQGKFLVEPAGQKTDANMQVNALLLYEGATANHKPELEIYADDVQCAHGSTSGALDDESLFYLRQRGLSDHQARALLVEAFIGEVLDEIPHDGVAEILRQQMKTFLDEV